jgi:hypothetical protein
VWVWNYGRVVCTMELHCVTRCHEKWRGSVRLIRSHVGIVVVVGGESKLLIFFNRGAHGDYGSSTMVFFSGFLGEQWSHVIGQHGRGVG